MHVLPREGGVLDQPDNEVRILEKMLEVFERYSDYKEKQDATRRKNRDRHSPKNRTSEITH